MDRSFRSSSLGIDREIRTAAEMRKRSLLAIASEVLLDEGRHIVHAEKIFCCPVGEKDSCRALYEEEALLLYPELWCL